MPCDSVRFTPLPLDADVVVPGNALPWFSVLVPMGIATLTARRPVRACSTVDCSANAHP